jgi:hypothetical protein
MSREGTSKGAHRAVAAVTAIAAVLAAAAAVAAAGTAAAEAYAVGRSGGMALRSKKFPRERQHTHSQLMNCTQ